jgi:hypothetical protein
MALTLVVDDWSYYLQTTHRIGAGFSAFFRLTSHTLIRAMPGHGAKANA